MVSRRQMGQWEKRHNLRCKPSNWTNNRPNRMNNRLNRMKNRLNRMNVRLNRINNRPKLDEQPPQSISSENAPFPLKTALFTPFMLFMPFMVGNAASKFHHEEHEGHEGTPAPPSRSGNSPAFERWEPRPFTATSPGRDERTVATRRCPVLPSLPGLCSFGDAPPSTKVLGYFQGAQPPYCGGLLVPSGK